MKKILVVAILAIVALGVNAQNGVRIWYGINSSGNDADGTKSKMNALNVGVDYTAPIDNTFDWSVGLSYQTKGFEIKQIDEKWSPGYIQIEGNGAWNFVKNNDTKLGIFTGPYVGFMVNEDDAEGIKKTDFGWQGGIQGYYKNLSLKIGYEYGFLDVIEEMDSKPYQVFFRIGYTF